MSSQQDYTKKMMLKLKGSMARLHSKIKRTKIPMGHVLDSIFAAQPKGQETSIFPLVPSESDPHGADDHGMETSTEVRHHLPLADGIHV